MGLFKRHFFTSHVTLGEFFKTTLCLNLFIYEVGKYATVLVSRVVQGCPRVKGVYIHEALRIVPASSRRRRQASYCSVSESRFRFYATLCFLASIHFLLEVSCPCSWGVGEHQPLAPGSQTKQVWPRPPQTESRSRERSDPVVVEQERNLVH